MKRRDFLQASAAAACLAVPAAQGAEAASKATPEYYEWRTYAVKDDGKQTAVLKYLEQAALPAWQRLGIGPVGVFTETGDKAGSSVHVLIVYKSIEEFAGARTALENDGEYSTAAAGYLAAAMQDPSFDRIESSLMVAFDGQPQLSVPPRKERGFGRGESQI